MKSIFFAMTLLSVSTSLAAAPKYCAAIRGNGQNIAAHWGSMARIVEELGLPEAMSGGSSASVTMFLLESLASNSLLKAEKNIETKNKKSALLLKTFPLYFAILAELENAAEAYAYIKRIKAAGSDVNTALSALETLSKNSEQLKKAFGKYGPLLNPELIKATLANPTFFKEEIKTGLKVFGAFDASKDAQLFFRPGFIDFKYFALLLGQMADFYAQDSDALNRFLNQCQTPKGVLQLGPICQGQFQQLLVGFVQASGPLKPSPQLFKSLGENITTYPSTSVLLGKDTIKKYTDFSTRYFKGELSEKESLENFHAANPSEDLKFGYWGDLKDLRKLPKELNRLFPGDEKARRFKALGTANWFEVLSVSPAEPGLANLQKLPVNTSADQVSKELLKDISSRWEGLTYQPGLISAGGWSDLHPTQVLKAHGCENVIYVSRTGGDSLFSQQVFIRLANLTQKIPFWTDLSKKAKDVEGGNIEGWKFTDKTAHIADTAWNRLYNLGNPESSHSRAIESADGVYCTNWNDYDPLKSKEDALGIVADAYTSPLVLPETSNLSPIPGLSLKAEDYSLPG